MLRDYVNWRKNYTTPTGKALFCWQKVVMDSKVSIADRLNQVYFLIENFYDALLSFWFSYIMCNNCIHITNLIIYNNKFVPILILYNSKQCMNEWRFAVVCNLIFLANLDNFKNKFYSNSLPELGTKNLSNSAKLQNSIVR